MFKHLKIAVKMSLATLAILGAAQGAFPNRANGSLIRDHTGAVTGSLLIAQKFERPEYFHPRPSAVDYDAAGSGASNLGPTNEELMRITAARVRNFAKENGRTDGGAPIDAVTASASGLDPDITPANALRQAARVATARRMRPDAVRELIEANTLGRQLGFLGERRVNVLALNLALDEIAGREELW